EKQFENHPDLRLEYFEIADVDTLTPIQRKKPSVKYRAFVAVYAEGVRLIDNIALN
ncbi:pantoate--beta-alanine ligase, partial [Pricia sp.]|uniref:pantoate--beta-alanine ligase n=1 Tax=Pricia sp. TaxID=2268138 RepID=UPI0035940224